MTSDYKKKYTDILSYIPKTYRSVANTSLIRNLHNKFLTKEEATPMLGYVGDKVVNDTSPYVAAANLDRELNSLVPTVYTKLGSEEYLFTFSDVLQKLALLGVDVDDFAKWGKALSFNFVPPIDLDKFSNYSRYRWYGHLLGTSLPYNEAMDPEYYVINKAGSSDWAKNNFWVHETDTNAFFAAQGYAFTIDSTVQAIRPIVEYNSELEAEMVLHISEGRPAATGTVMDQTVSGYKTEFNQKPLFNLYLHDGTHSGFVSPIFYFAEGNSYPVDKALKTRIQTNAYGDFTFEQGLVSKDGKRILFYKKGNALKSIWEKGIEEAPVYYVKDSNHNLVATEPALDVEGIGAWKFPSQMFHNVSHENRKLIGYGDLLGHFTDIISKQVGFIGNPYGDNNFRNLPVHNYGIGGRIKDFNTNFGLFLGLTNQLDNSVPSIIEFGKLQYAQMLGSVSEFVIKNFAEAITDGSISVPNTQTSNTLDSKLIPLFESFLSFVTTRNDSSVFSDTTSAIAGWPATMPYLGLAKKVAPSIYFDKVIGSLVLTHHDGHTSIISTANIALDKKLAGISFLRSDGQTTPGVIGTQAPTRPYKNQFWFDVNTNTLKTFSIQSDTTEIFPGIDGVYFYSRDSDSLFVFNTVSGSYVPVQDKSVCWKPVNTTTVINQLLLMTEQKLYNGCPFDSSSVDVDSIIAANATKANGYLEQELAIFAAKHSLDISAGDYVSADAFTWNYRNAVISGATGARWFALYESYFGTSRPNMQPWILQGYTSKPAWWDNMYADNTGTRLWNTSMWSDIKNDTTPSFPAPTGPWTKKLCVDVTNDNLLPPYVSATSSNAGEALINTIPSGIAAGYAFGEQGPAEMSWRVSVDCNYDKLKVCYKLNPVEFINTTWGYNNVSVDGYEIDRHEHRKLNHHDFVLHGEVPTAKFTGYSITDIHQNPSDAVDTKWTLTCIGNTESGGLFSVEGNAAGLVSKSCKSGIEFICSQIRFTVNDGSTDFNIGDKLILSLPSAEVTYVPTKYAKFLGLNQWFVNLNRYNSVDMSIALADNILRDWELKLGHRMSGLINTELFDVKTDQFALHSSDYEILIKENKNISSHWLNALRVQLLRIGTFEYVDGKRVPKNKGADWVFRIETFNSHNPSIDYYEYNAAGKFQTFFANEKANSKDQWNHLTERTGLVTKVTPFVVTGIENVANIIFGYVDKLNEDGWRFNQGDDPQVDSGTGRVINWQMFIERFINQQYLGVEAGSGIVLNPFATSVWFATPHGFVSNLRNPTTANIASSQSIFDSFGNTISNKDIQIFRNDDMTQIQSSIVIGGVHLLLDEYEHIALFTNYTSDQSRRKLIYDPFLGVRVNRLYLSAERQSHFNGRLSFGGHYIKDHQVKRNIEASISDILNYYDADKMIDKSSTAKYARGLLGYEPKKYMEDIDLSDKSQFGFWRGLISNKGSNLSVDAFLNSARFEAAKIDEFWAYKLAQFGDARQLAFPEIKLSSADAQHNYTKIEFVQPGNVGHLGFINIYPSDETRWVSPEDQAVPLAFDAEMIGEVVFEGIWPNQILDLKQNGKDIIADYVEVYEQVFLRTGDMSPFQIRVYNFVLVNSTTIKFTADTTIDLNTYILPATRKFTVKCFGPSQPKFNPAKLIDYKNKVVISDLALWDPARGAHTSEALEIVDMIAKDDPAKYNYSVNTVNNVLFDQYRPWDNKEVGRVWWNTKDLDYIPYSDKNIFPLLDVRLSYWGTLADWASVELYEWTESTVHPSKYAALVAAQEGNSSIPADIRASGNVAMSELYSRTRTWRQRPIAWGYTDTPGSVVPAISSIGEDTVSFRSDASGNTIAILSNNDWTSAFTSLDIGHKISGGVFHYNTDDVSDVNNFKLTKPYGEAIVSGLNQSVVIGSSDSVDTPVFVLPSYTY
jgi:hypothetical protein